MAIRKPESWRAHTGKQVNQTPIPPVPPAAYQSQPPRPPEYGPHQTQHYAHPPVDVSKSFVATAVLAVFFGMFGADRFYLGKYPSAVLKLVTFGGFGVWWLIDVILTFSGSQTDASGAPLAQYEQNRKKAWIGLATLFALFLLWQIVATFFLAFSVEGGWGAISWAGMMIMVVLLTGIVGYLVYATRHLRGVPTDFEVGALRAGEESTPSSVIASLTRLTELRDLYLLHAAPGDSDAALVLAHLDSL